jgi:hypothetical protein
MRRSLRIFSIATLLLCTTTSSLPQSNEEVANDSRPAKFITYKNKQYGFKFYLPKSWKGYSIIVGKWGGGVHNWDSSKPPKSEEGPMITIRHPHWTQEKRYQDIPIMIFTYPQWDLIDKGDLAVSAAPFGPGEIGRNSRYVFALPPRYNFADAIGVEEVIAIMRSNPLYAY